MRFTKKTKTYHASNVSFNTKSLVAVSYDWWIFVKPINGKVIFNNYNYSRTTQRHQSKVRWLLDDMGIQYEVVQMHNSLSNLSHDNFIQAFNEYDKKLEEAHRLVNSTRTNQWTKEHNARLITQLNTELDTLSFVADMDNRMVAKWR